MYRSIIAFFVAELVIGLVALAFVLNVFDHYLGAGRPLLTARGERVLGPVVAWATPFARRLTAWWKPRQAAVTRLVVLAHQVDLALYPPRRWHLTRIGPGQRRKRRRRSGPGAGVPGDGTGSARPTQ